MIIHGGITVSPKEQSNIEEKLENIIIQNQDIKIESLHGRVENYRSANTIYTILQSSLCFDFFVWSNQYDQHNTVKSII